MGLSQLHQLRGRVGRGRERAYAYFFFPPEKPLTETAHERLQTIAANTELGSGMQVAMKDLEIRGAGNLLGGEQSGHIAGVGFDLYMRMVGEAVADFRGRNQKKPLRCKSNFLSMRTCPDYVGHERLRLEAYRKIAAATSAQQLADVHEELVDRYGQPPAEVANLFAVATFRNEVRDVGLRDVTVQGKFVRFAPVELPESATLKLKRLYPGSMIKPVVRTVLVPYPTQARIGGQPLRGEELLDWARRFISTIIAPPVVSKAD